MKRKTQKMYVAGRRRPEKRRRSWKRVLSGLLAAVLTVTSVPSIIAQAAPSEDTVQEYDYAKMYSLEGGKSGDYIAGYYKDTGQENKRDMNYGEIEYSDAAEPPVRCGVSHLSGQA